MNTKKILSAVAAVAIVSTGLMAFETDTTQRILHSNYVGGVPSKNDLNLSTTQKGDALIYPYYYSQDGWTSEIVIRNTSPYATVAKVSLHDYRDSDDMGDFNIYLSPYDVFRFTIKDGAVRTADGSIPTEVLSPRHGPRSDKANFLDLDGNEEQLEVLNMQEKHPGVDAKRINKGYIIVLGMTQYHLPEETDINEDRKSSSYGQAMSHLPYHHKHLELFQDYRRLLDNCRPGWRKAYSGVGIKEGVITVKGVPAPDTNISSQCTDLPVGDRQKSVITNYNLDYFGDVHEDTFIGTVRVFKEDGKQSRDLLLNATALSNYSEDNMFLWAEGEYAALHDRRIEPDSEGKSIYPKDKIWIDTQTFLTKSAYYTFDAKGDADVANQLIVTQPTKKIMNQLFGRNLDDNSMGIYWIDDASKYGGFALDYYLLDEDENSDIIDPPLERITSPHTGTADKLLDDELQVIHSDRLEDSEEYNELFTNNDGYSYVNLSGGRPDVGLPAIVTEMVGSKVDGVAQVNWLYTPTVK